VGISGDPVDRQLEFDETNRLGFPLLSDADGAIAAQFGVARRLGPPKRATFVIGTDRRIVAAIGGLGGEINVSKHADDALDALRARR